MPACLELEAAFIDAWSDEPFVDEYRTVLREFAGRPTPVTPLDAARGTSRPAHLRQARRPGAHRLAQDQQRHRPDAADQTDGQASRHRRDGRRTTRRRHRDRGRATRSRVHRLHGRGRHRAPDPQRLSHGAARFTGGAGDLGQSHAERRRERSDARVGHVRRRHALLHWIGDGSAPLPVDGARVPEHHRTRGGGQLEEFGVEVPDVVIACVGGGSNAAGVFAGFANASSRLVGIEAAGGSAVGSGSPGVLHGMRSLLMQDEFGQIEEAHSISAGLDYPGIGPEHAHLADDRARRVLRHRRRGRHRCAAALEREGGDHPGPGDGPRRGVAGPRGGTRRPRGLDGAAQSLGTR